MRKSKWDETIDNAAQRLREFYPYPRKSGSVRIYTVLNHVSRSGMFRKISAFIIIKNNPVCLAYRAPVSGCGMDMGFHLAYVIYCAAYGPYNKKKPGPPYQDFLRHSWL
jgi:hypothetical protein